LPPLEQDSVPFDTLQSPAPKPSQSEEAQLQDKVD
jgi:hypothetical protein